MDAVDPRSGSRRRRRSSRPAGGIPISTGGETAIGGTITVIGDGYLLRNPANPDIYLTSTGYSVNANTSHGLEVVFRPQSLGVQPAYVAITQTLCTRIGSPCDTIRCTGTGITTPPPPLCGVSTNTIDMGTAFFGQAKDTTLRITSLGGGTLSGTVQFLDNSPPFSLVGPTTYSLGTGQSQDFTIRFTSSGTPGHVYTYVGNLSAGSQCTAQGLGIQVTAVAREAPRPPACAISPTTLDFGNVPVGQSKDLTFDLENSGGGTLCGSVTESCPDFAIIQNASYCITPPGFVRVTVRFSPSSAGFKQCTVSAGAGCPAVTVRGTGS